MSKKKKPRKSGSNLVQGSHASALVQYLRSHKIPVAIWAAIITAVATLISNVFLPSGAVPEQSVSAPISNNGDGVQVVANGSVDISYDSTGITQQQFDQLVEQVQVSRKLAERLLRNLEEKDVAIADQNAKLHEALERSAALGVRLGANDDEVSVKVKGLLDQGKIEEAELLLSASFSSRILDIETQKITAASEAFELGIIKLILLENFEARKYFEKAVELAPTNPEYLVALAYVEGSLDNFDSAETHLMQALSETNQRFGEGSLWTGSVLSHLGILYIMHNDPAKAVPFFEKSLSICMAASGDNTKCIALARSNLAGALRSVGQDIRASALFEESWPILTKEYANDPKRMALLLNNMAYATGEDECAKALDLLQKAEDYYWKGNSSADHVYANILENQSECLIKTGRTSEAIVKLNEALKIYQHQLGNNSLKVAMVCLELGRAWHVIPNFVNAIEYYEKAYILYKQELGDEKEDTKVTLIHLKAARLGTLLSFSRLKK